MFLSSCTQLVFRWDEDPGAENFTAEAVMFLPDQEVLGITPTGVIPPAIMTKIAGYANKFMQVFRGGFYNVKPIDPPSPTVPLELLEKIHRKFKSFSDSVKNAAEYVSSVKECCIKNAQTASRLEQRVATLEDQLARSFEIATSALDVAKETKLLQEKTYLLMKEKMELLRKNAGEGKLDRLKRCVEVPEKIMSIIGTLLGYVVYVRMLTEMVEATFGNKLPQAEEITSELESMVAEIEKFEIRESSYALIGGFSTDLLNETYEPDNKFSVTVHDSVDYPNYLITSSIRKGKINEVILFGSLGNDSELKLVTDMSSNGTISFAGEVYEGLRETLSFATPSNNAQVTLMYQHPLGGLCGTIEGRPTKAFHVSGIFGLRWFSVGGDIKYDATSSKFLKYDIGAGFDNELYSASVSITNRCQTLRGTLARKIWPGTSVGSELTHSTSKHEKTLSLGLSHQYNPETLIKVKVSSDFEGAYVGAAALRYNWKERSSVSLSLELQYKEKKVEPKFGLSFTIHP